MLTRYLSPSLVGYFRRTRAEVSAAAFKLVFAMLVISAAFGATYADAKDLFLASELRGILVHGTGRQFCTAARRASCIAV